jgi:opacity protein-like surface antigen
MKKTILLLLVSVFALQMNAQINEVGKFYITPKVGYNMANVSKFGGDPRSGINVGISGEYAINEMISVEPGIFYSMQGTSFKVSSVKFALNNDYINVPILLKAYVADGFNIFVGPQVGYLTGSKIKIKTGSSLLDNIAGILGNSIDFGKYENDFDFAVVIGAGYQLTNGFSISANYNLGLNKLLDVPKVTLGGSQFDFNPDAKNNVLQINVGYRF